IQSIKNTGESHDDFEQRTWRERLHVDEKGEVFIPPLALKNTLANVAKFLSETVPGKGKATYTKHFLAGILVVQPLMLGVKGKDVEGVRMHVPSDGRKGGTTRVYKTFPVVQEWQSKTEIILLDPLLVGKPEKVEEYLIHAGKFIGLLAMRPQTGGYYGRFTIDNFKVD
ncbi:MAG: hypothetical protein ACYTEW_25770, partial [Planctomycetota bacterium]